MRFDKTCLRGKSETNVSWQFTLSSTFICGCRLGKGMHDGEGEKVTRQGGCCRLRGQMIEKEGKKEPRIKAGEEDKR